MLEVSDRKTWWIWLIFIMTYNVLYFVLLSFTVKHQHDIGREYRTNIDIYCKNLPVDTVNLF